MKDWARERRHPLTHWFQPLDRKDRRKHDSFEPPARRFGHRRIFRETIDQRRTDASSFPSGGIRATFEAAATPPGDTTSPAFLKEDAAGNVTLTILRPSSATPARRWTRKPCCSAPWALNRQGAPRVRALGNKNQTRHLDGRSRAGVLPDRQKLLRPPPDLQLAGRTLFGALSPQGQSWKISTSAPSRTASPSS